MTNLKRAIWACVLLASTALAQDPSELGNDALHEAYSVAKKSVGTLKELTTQQNAAQMGFASPEEAAHAELTPPLREYLVEIDGLREYPPGADPRTLLHTLEKIVVPVAVDGVVKSSIVVEKTGAGWKPVSFGTPRLAKLLGKARDASMSAGAASAEACFVVHVPGLNRYFIGYLSGAKLMLTPVLDDATLGFQAGHPLRASKVFTKLKVTAKHYNGLPQ